jgi:hypothetical protein
MLRYLLTASLRQQLAAFGNHAIGMRVVPTALQNGHPRPRNVGQINGFLIRVLQAGHVSVDIDGNFPHHLTLLTLC